MQLQIPPASGCLCRRRRRREAERAVRNGGAAAAAAAGGGAAGGGPPSSVSSLMLTTGTPLMLEVHQSLAYWICRCLDDPATEHLEFELSDSTVKVCAPLTL